MTAPPPILSSPFLSDTRIIDKLLATGAPEDDVLGRTRLMAAKLRVLEVERDEMTAAARLQSQSGPDSSLEGCSLKDDKRHGGGDGSRSPFSPGRFAQLDYDIALLRLSIAQLEFESYAQLQVQGQNTDAQVEAGCMAVLEGAKRKVGGRGKRSRGRGAEKVKVVAGGEGVCEQGRSIDGPLPSRSSDHDCSLAAGSASREHRFTPATHPANPTSADSSDRSAPIDQEARREDHRRWLGLQVAAWRLLARLDAERGRVGRAERWTAMANKVEEEMLEHQGGSG